MDANPEDNNGVGDIVAERLPRVLQKLRKRQGKEAFTLPA